MNAIRAARHAQPTYELLLTDATDVFVNGWPKPVTDLRPGDRVGVFYASGETDPDTLRPFQIRAHRFP